jgi:hypothetical protein
MYLLPDRSKSSKRKTSVKKNTKDPVYEESFRVCSFFLNNNKCILCVLVSFECTRI